MRFAELLARSCFSFLEGASHPEELCARARELELTAIALCDRDGLYGSVRMHVAARELREHRGLEQRVVVGAELTLERPGLDYKLRPLASVALLCEDHAGYSALCRLLTRAHAHHPKGEAGISAADIAADSAGLFAVLPLDPRCPLSADEIERLKQAFGERLAVAVWRHLEPHDGPRLEHAAAVAARFELPIVASARPLYHHPSRKPLGDVVRCIRLGTTLDRAGTRLSLNTEEQLRGAGRMRRLFLDNPDWIAQSADIAARCRFSLDELRYSFPSAVDLFFGGSSELTPDENLRLAVEQGCHDRYPDGVPADVRLQLDKELRLVAELQVAPFFLGVQQIVRIARERRILCQGRGSAANSAVCYVLGITAVDPVRSSLLFERFMSTARREPPDIDVDFEHERREEVIQEIYRRYGRDRAAMVSEVIAYRGKSALREVGKVFGLSADQLDRLSHAAHHHHMDCRGDVVTSTAKDIGRLQSLAKRGLDPGDRRLARVVELARELEGFPRHLSIHVGGFVLSSEPLDKVAPVEPATMADRTVIPWDKDDIDALGFFKVDVLGLGMLTAVRKALALIHEREHGSAAPLPGPPPGGGREQEVTTFDPIAAFARIPAEDPAVYDACCRADTVGVFQIESRAQMAMLPILRPRCFYDLVVEVGIVRPGPIQGKMVHPYLRRRTGEEQVGYPHPCLKPILERTLGVPLFQEQVMQIAITGAGYDPGEADQLRRDMAAWRKNGRLLGHRDKLLGGFEERGIDPEFGRQLFQQIMGFGEYGFPESHSSSFALIVYASAWLKVHHPAAFACALVNSQPMGFYSPASIVRDAQAHGVEVRPIRVESSGWDCTLSPSGPSDEPQAIRLGMRLVRGLGRESAERIVAARTERAYRDLDDLLRRAGLRRDELEALAEAGALEELCPSRREALWRIRAPREGGLYEGLAIEPDQPIGLPSLTAREQLSLDYGTTGISLHDHPMRHLRPALGRRRVRLASEQQSFKRGQRVTVAGVVLTRQRPMTASGVVFITLEDETGTLNLVLYANVFDKYELVARHAGILLARGQVDRRGEVVHVRVSHLERLDLPQGSDLPHAERERLFLRSRDFH